MQKSQKAERLLSSLAILGPHLEALPGRHEIPSEIGIGAARALWTVAAARGRIGVGELADALQVPLPRASRLLGDLEAHGLVERRRDPQDRRRVEVALAPEGRRLAAAWKAAQSVRLHALLDVLGARDAENLVRIFERAAARLGDRSGRDRALGASAGPKGERARHA